MTVGEAMAIVGAADSDLVGSIQQNMYDLGDVEPSADEAGGYWVRVARNVQAAAQ